jgi:hypothetical protein
MVKSIYIFSLIPIIHAISNITTNYFPTGTINPGSIRVIILLILISLFFYNYKKLYFGKLFFIIILFLGYNLFLVLLNQDLLSPIINWIRLSIPFLILFIGVVVVDSRKKFTILNKAIIISLSFYCVNYILSNLFGFGAAIYRESVFLGGAGAGLTNEMAIMVLISLSFLSVNKNKLSNKWKIFGYAVISLSIIIILITLRRGAYLVLFAGFIVYFYLKGVNKNDIKYIVISSIIILLLSPLYIYTFIDRIETRAESRDGSIANIQIERRYLELFWVPNSLNNHGVTGWLFGTHNLNSEKYFGGRPLHVGYMAILHGTGIIGLVLFGTIIIMLIKTLKYKSNLYKNYNIEFNKELFVLNFALIIALLVYLLTSRLHGFTVTTPVFLIYGSTLGLLRTNNIFNR